ncbi:MAG TPA: dTDP-4-dehydrorhamnose 3,5-epimerase [Flavobacteriales bacterium]|nr:dTDP-4-dehydrorhamnose 3,5-epimerase [Flavobacteriales bacterium]
MIEVFPTGMAGLLHLRAKTYADERGRFMETFNAKEFSEKTGITAPFVQDNESRSKAGVLRGLHLQMAPHTQAKLVRVVKGAAMDVCVDLRPGSATRGKHFMLRLDDLANDMLYIPEGFAHGFLALEDDTVFTYKCSAYYAPATERTILWNDPDLNIPWGIDDPVVSSKDLQGTYYRDFAAGS